MAKHIGPQAYTAYAALRRRILAGDFAPDERLPAQAALAAEFGVALLTMRQALDRLEQDGLVSSEQGRGTFVRARLSSAQKQALATIQSQVLEQIATDRPLSEVLAYLARSIEQESPEMLCSILLLDSSGTRLTHGAAPSLPAPYVAAIDGVAIGPDVGSCGTAAFRREPVVVSDIATDPLWQEYRDLALSHGLRACWSTPIFAVSGELLGTFAIYYDAARSPRPQDRELIQHTTHIAAIAIERRRDEQALRESEERLRALFENAAIGISLTDMDGRVVDANPALREMLGYGEAELRGLHFTAFTHPNDREADLTLFSQLAAGQRDSYELEKRYIRNDGEQVWVRLTVSLTPHAGDEPRFAVAVVENINERKHAEEALRESEERYRTLVETSPDCIILADLEGTILMGNQPLADLYGSDSPQELVGMNAFDLFARQDRTRAIKNIRKMIESRRPRRNVEYEMRRRDGPSFPVEVSSSLIVDREGEPQAITAIVRDISERKQAEATLAHQALHDALTDLPNRTLLHDRLNQGVLAARRENTPLALLLMDLDRFKEINDTFGHHHGDLLLQQLGPRLQRTLRESDTVARLGGDEFAVLLPATDENGAIRSAGKVLAALEQPFALEGQSLDIGASIGIAVYPQDGEDADALLRRADVAMYVAKRADTGYAVYSPDQDQYTPSRITMIADLREAIDQYQLRLHYQPKFNLKTLRVDSVEALARWRHPRHGDVPPDRFIPLAEQGGLIKPLSLWVLTEALRQCRHWHAIGLNVRVAWNLSPRMLHDAQLVETIAGTLKGWKADPHWLEVEITESALMADADRALETLNQLHAMGVRITVDDFGTGYSSLMYLRQLPLDSIKIDKSFVAGMTENADDAIIVRSVLDLGHNLGLQVVAEGVETQQVLDVLTAHGCDYAQGYLLGKPVPDAELISSLRDWHEDGAKSAE